MKTVKKEKTDRLKKMLERLLKERPDAHDVANRHGVILHIIAEEYPGTVRPIPKDKAKDIIHSIIYLDRILRLLTEGEQKETKEILSQQFQVEELGYEPDISPKII